VRHEAADMPLMKPPRRYSDHYVPTDRSDELRVVLNLLGLGLTDGDIGLYLQRSTNAVQSMVSTLKFIHNVETRIELIRLSVLTFSLPAPRKHTHPRPLSPKEAEVVALVVQGQLDKQIAHKLGVKIGTVRTYLDRVKGKTGLRTRHELILDAIATQRHSETFATPATCTAAEVSVDELAVAETPMTPVAPAAKTEEVQPRFRDRLAKARGALGGCFEQA
jgi:DNA-binding NarL/FixJ family response regulator